MRHNGCRRRCRSPDNFSQTHRSSAKCCQMTQTEGLWWSGVPNLFTIVPWVCAAQRHRISRQWSYWFHQLFTSQLIQTHGCRLFSCQNITFQFFCWVTVAARRTVVLNFIWTFASVDKISFVSRIVLTTAFRSPTPNLSRIFKSSGFFLTHIKV